MRKVLFFILMCCTMTGFGQTSAVKLGVTGISYGNYALTYERAVSEKSTVGVTFGYWNADVGMFDFKSVLDVDEGIWFNEINNGINFVVDYRMYVSKKEALIGFYLSPYLRYWDLDFQLGDEIRNDYFDVNSKLKSYGVGFQMGYQWVIANKFTIDWYFFGLGVEMFSANGSYVLTDDQAGFDYSTIENDVVKTFTDFSFMEDKVESTVRNNDLQVKIPLTLPGFRTGFTIGYAF